MEVSSEIRGLAEAKRSMEKKAEAMHGKPVLDAFRQATLLIQREVRLGAPADTGKLRNSIVTEVNLVGGKDVQGIIGTNVTYAPYMELGTKPHTPPIDALRVWASRHGIAVGAVVKAIAERGLEPRHFFKNAFDNNRTEVENIIGRAIEGVVKIG